MPKPLVHPFALRPWRPRYVFFRKPKRANEEPSQWQGVHCGDQMRRVPKRHRFLMLESWKKSMSRARRNLPERPLLEGSCSKRRRKKTTSLSS